MRTICPDEEMLADYIEGRLSDAEGSQIEEHLAGCEMCLEEFVAGRSTVQGEDQFHVHPVPPEVTHAAVNLVKSRGGASCGALVESFKRLLRGLYAGILDLFRPTPWGRWQLASIRGNKRVLAKDLIYLRKTFPQMEAEIEIEKTGERSALIRVTVPKEGRKGETVRVTLKSRGREISSALLDGDYLLFDDIPFGHYSLNFARDGVRLGAYSFEIKETRHGR